MKEIVSVTTISPCEMSSPSPKFFGACSKFPGVPLFRPNLVIEDYSTMRWVPFHPKATQEVLCHDKWFSNCSDDINSTACDYASQVA